MRPAIFDKEGPLRSITRSFQYRNYRLFFCGQALSLTGTWIQNVALSWLVYSLTGSAFYLGVVEFSTQIPCFLFVLLAGVLIDRWNRRRTFMVTSALAMMQAFVLFILVASGKITIWHIIPLCIFLGLVNSFDLPVRQSFVFNIIEKREDLGNAVSLNNAMFNIARFLGPSLAGMLIAAVGEGVCFLINGLSFLSILAALLTIQDRPQTVTAGKAHIWQGLKEGFVYVFHSTSIRSIILLQGYVSLTGWSTGVLMPVFVKDFLQGGPHTFGFILGFSGMGALIGTLYVASRKDAAGLVRIIPLAAGIYGLGLIALSQCRIQHLSMFMALFTGYGIYVQMAAGGTVLQTIVDDNKRGRVMSFFTLAFMGTVPFGSLLAGSLAGRVGADRIIMLGGVLCVAGALLFTTGYRPICKSVSLHMQGRPCAKTGA